MISPLDFKVSLKKNMLINMKLIHFKFARIAKILQINEFCGEKMKI